MLPPQPSLSPANGIRWTSISSEANMNPLPVDIESRTGLESTAGWIADLNRQREQG